MAAISPPLGTHSCSNDGQDEDEMQTPPRDRHALPLSYQFRFGKHNSVRESMNRIRRVTVDEHLIGPEEPDQRQMLQSQVRSFPPVRSHDTEWREIRWGENSPIHGTVEYIEHAVDVLSDAGAAGPRPRKRKRLSSIKALKAKLAHTFSNLWSRRDSGYSSDDDRSSSSKRGLLKQRTKSGALSTVSERLSSRGEGEVVQRGSASASVLAACDFDNASISGLPGSLSTTDDDSTYSGSGTYRWMSNPISTSGTDSDPIPSYHVNTNFINIDPPSPLSTFSWFAEGPGHYAHEAITPPDQALETQAEADLHAAKFTRQLDGAFRKHELRGDFTEEHLEKLFARCYGNRSTDLEREAAAVLVAKLRRRELEQRIRRSNLAAETFRLLRS